MRKKVKGGRKGVVGEWMYKCVIGWYMGGRMNARGDDLQMRWCMHRQRDEWLDE